MAVLNKYSRFGLNSNNSHCSVNNVNEPLKNLIGKRVIGIDPGCKNIVFCVELHPVTRKIVRKMRLSSAHFDKYEKHKKEKKSLIKYQPAKGNDSSSSVGDFLEELKNYKENYNNLWDIKTVNNNSAKCIKQKNENKILNNFVNNLLGDTRNNPVYVAFGSGNGKIRDIIPLKIAELIKQKIGKENFSFVDEWNTSKVCHRCLQPLGIVEFRHNKPTSQEQKANESRVKNNTKRRNGLLVCCSEPSNRKYNNNNKKQNAISCPIGGAFVNRDSNAAVNIAQRVLFDKGIINNLTRGIRVIQPIKVF